MFLQVSIVHDGRDGLIFLATGQPAVALQAFAPLPAGGLAPWSDDAGQADDDVTGFGRALAQALLPPALQRLLAQAGEGELQLWLGSSLAAVPWELAQVDGRALDERFVITRQVLADGESGELAPVAQSAASLQVLDGPAHDAGLRAAAAAAGRAGQAALVLPPQATVARQALALALAEGLTIARAAQRARAAARQQRLPGGSAWLYGDGALLAGHSADAAGASSSGDDVRQVSILSCDLAGSTALMHRLGDEEYSERLARYHQRVADIARAHAGLADDPQGDDGLMCYFGHPVASEDAAAMALRAGLALSTATQDLDLPLRIGISTGRVVIRNGQPVGAAVHHAARLQQHAAPGSVLVGAATRRIAGDRFTFCLVDAAPQFKGFDEAGAVWRLVGEQPALGTERFDGRDDLAAFVGRQAELAWLQRHWQAAVAGQRQVLLLHGEAGIGKSRLVREFRQSLAQQGQRTLECRCAAEHSGSAFQPLIDLLRRRLQVHETDPAMLQLARLRALQVTTGPDGAQALALLGALLSVPEAVLPPLPGAGSAERRRQRTMALLLQVATGLSDAAPVCLILEDVQWIDPSTRELVQRLIEGPRRQRVLLLLTLRGGAGDAAACALAPAGQPRLALDGLAPVQAQALLQQASGGVLQDAALARWLASRADGVPLFIEQSARMAAALATQRPGADLSRRLQEAVPDTLHDLLMARLDQLPQAKRAAQLGAALGRAFPQALIEAVNGHADAPFHLPALAAQLDALVQAGLLTVQAEGTQRVYTFRHALLRDAAHQSLLERDRRRLHLAIAAVLQADFAPLCASQPERLAPHQALAGQPAQALASWERAARHAASRSALHEAIGHVRSALALLDQLPTPAERDTCELRLQLRLSGLLIATAGYGAERVEAVYRRASALARALGDDRAQARLRLGLQGYHFMRADFAAAQTLADEMAAHLGLQPEPLARLQADWAQANLLFHRGQLPQALALTEQCLADHQRQAPRAGTVQDPAVLCLGYAAWALWQLGRADEALRRAREAVALAEQLNHPFSLGQALGFLAVVHHFRGEALPGLRAAQRAIEVCEGGGFVQWLAHARVLQGRLRVALGEVEAGLADLARGQAEWVASGAVVTRPFYLALQAEALAAAGRPDAALSLLAEAQALVERHGERYYEPELLRLSGALRLDAGEGDASTLPWLEAALASARGLQQPGLALRAALSLAPRWAAQGRRAEARALLADSLAAAPEGAATQDPRQAAALLATWSQ